MSYEVPIYKVSLVKESAIAYPVEQIRSGDNAAGLLQRYLGDTDREHFVVVLLDTKNKVIGVNTVSIGSLDVCIVHPREVFKPAILANASRVLLGHNHPSGDTTPSPEDIAVTKRMMEAGNLLGIDVLDHIIVGNGHTSLRTMGHMG